MRCYCIDEFHGFDGMKSALYLGDILKVLVLKSGAMIDKLPKVTGRSKLRPHGNKIHYHLLNSGTKLMCYAMH